MTREYQLTNACTLRWGVRFGGWGTISVAPAQVKRGVQTVRNHSLSTTAPSHSTSQWGRLLEAGLQFGILARPVLVVTTRWSSSCL